MRKRTPKNPTAAELDSITAAAIQAAMNPKRAEKNCPFREDDPERREHWLAIFRAWRSEAEKGEQS